MRGESQYYRGPAGYGYADADEEYWYRQDQVPADREYWEYEDDHGRADGATGGAEGNERLTGLTGLLLAVITVHLAGPWTTVPGLGR